MFPEFIEKNIETSIEFYSFIWDFYEFFSDACSFEFFFSHGFSDELLTRDFEEFPCTISIIVLPEDSY